MPTDVFSSEKIHKNAPTQSPLKELTALPRFHSRIQGRLLLRGSWEEEGRGGQSAKRVGWEEGERRKWQKRTAGREGE